MVTFLASSWTSTTMCALGCGHRRTGLLSVPSGKKRSQKISHLSSSEVQIQQSLSPKDLAPTGVQ